MSVKYIVALLVAATLLGPWGLTGHAQAPTAAVDTAGLGPQVGAVVPPISGVDQFGRSQTLATLSGPKGLMLVFSRSADW